MTEAIEFERGFAEGDRHSDQEFTFTHPDDVLLSGLSLQEKRGLLASWASDAHAVPNLPEMRQLPSGAIVSVDSILTALRALDGSDQTDRRDRPGHRSLRRRLSLVSGGRGHIAGATGTMMTTRPHVPLEPEHSWA